jgi:hypothetical protein
MQNLFHIATQAKKNPGRMPGLKMELFLIVSLRLYGDERIPSLLPRSMHTGPETKVPERA